MRSLVRYFQLSLMLAIIGLSAAWQTPVRAETCSTERAKAATARLIVGEFDSERVFRSAKTGSGVIIAPEGLIIAPRQLVMQSGNKTYPEIWAGLVNPRAKNLPPNRAVKLKILGEDAALGLVLLQVQTATTNSRFPFIKLGSSDGIGYGDVLNVVGFPNYNGGVNAVNEVAVLNMDENAGEIWIEGALLRGTEGGAVVGDDCTLLGILVRIVPSQKVPFFDEHNVPVGEVVIENVSIVRTAETIADFVRQTVSGAGTAPTAPTVISSVQITGAVTDKVSGKPIPNATVGILSPNAETPEYYIDSSELLAYGKTDGRGAFSVNRRLRSGKYVVKVVSVGYKTVIKEVTVPNQIGRLIFEMVPEK